MATALVSNRHITGLVVDGDEGIGPRDRECVIALTQRVYKAPSLAQKDRLFVGTRKATPASLSPSGLAAPKSHRQWLGTSLVGSLGALWPTPGAMQQECGTASSRRGLCPGKRA